MLAALSENWIFLFIVLVINNGNISCMRGILRDMLVGNRNGKAERRIYKKQTLRQRISLRYIFPYLKRSRQAYVLWHRRYVVQYAILVPEIITLVTAAVLLPDEIMRICLALCACKFAFFVYMRITVYTDGFKHPTRYAKKGR